MRQQQYAEWRQEKAKEPDWKHYIMVMQWLEKLKIKMVLDYGAGEGFYVHVFNYHGIRCMGFDPNKELIEKAYGLAKGKLSDTIPNFIYDLVICIDVLEHTTPEQEQEVINNLIRLSKKYILLSICDASLWDKYPDPTHINCKSRAYWEFQFKARGLKQIPIPQDWWFGQQLYLFEKVKK